MGDSSSVRIETARELLKSACFIIGLKFDETVDSDAIKKQLVGEDFDGLFKAGLEEVKARVKTGNELLKKAVENAPEIENYCYKNTIREIRTFFKVYDIYNFAHDIPCMIDYPLADAVGENLQGIDYINDYLQRLIIENEFCSRFETDTVTALLKGITTQYADSHMNIYEAVAANALALTLLRGDIYTLDITGADREKLFMMLSSKQEERMWTELQAAASALCACLDITAPAAIDYVMKTISTLQPRLKQVVNTKQLEVIFPSLYREREATKPAVRYIDGALMDDDQLRELVSEISECRFAADKIALVKQNVHSLRDYAEILNICFWGDESIALFETLQNDELEMLGRFIRHQQSRDPEWQSESGWETRLTEYLRKHK